jgi:ankyrin repeat protein
MLLQINTSDVNSIDILGWTPLMWAAFVGSQNIVLIMLEKRKLRPIRKRYSPTIQNKVCTGCGWVGNFVNGLFCFLFSVFCLVLGLSCYVLEG